MKFVFIAAGILVCVASQPTAAQTTCSEAYAGCQKAKDGNRCDVVCKAYCAKEKKTCLKTGNFTSKTSNWTGLEKK